MINASTSHPYRRWVIACAMAVALHLAAYVLLTLYLVPDKTIQVTRMVPSPGDKLSVTSTQAVAAAVFFSSPQAVPNPQSASIYRIEPDGKRVWVGAAHPHDTHPRALAFDPVEVPGIYEIVVQDDVFAPPYALDGEFLGTFPSGDGVAGGAFVARFEVDHKPTEIFTASVYEPQKPERNEELPMLPTPAPQTESESPPTPPAPPPPRSSQPRPQRPSSLPQMAEGASPLPTTTLPPEPDPEPGQRPITVDQLRVSPLNLAPALLQTSAEQAAAIFAEQDANPYVAHARTAKNRYQSAFLGEGPAVGTGQEGNSIAHQKDVAEYLALMHKEIHPQWAHGYLLRIDTVYQRTDPRLSNPNLETVLEIILDSLGRVHDVRVVRGTGITDYDSEAIGVAWKSSPGIPPPPEMRSDDGKSYIHWTFWRDTRQCGVFGVKVFQLNKGRMDSLDFSLKAVQLQEQKLGLTPSVLPQNLRTNTNPGTTKPDPSPGTTPPSQPLPERIDPMQD